jgi:ribosomal protein L4
MRVNALFSVLSKKYAAGQVLFVNELALAAPKTAEAREIMNKLGTIAGFEEVGTRRKNALYVVLPKMDVAAKKSFQNMGNVLMGTVSTLNPVDVLSYKYLVLVAPEESVKALEAKLAK